MSLLILGGTADGRILADALFKAGIPVIYSVAGLVRMPAVTCEVVSGGFTQFGGLDQFVQTRSINAILDVTHPYAQTMSTKAVAVSRKLNIPCWRFHREAWQPQAGDNWKVVKVWRDAFPMLQDQRAVFLTAGQVDQNTVDVLASNSKQKQLLRTAVEPKIEMPNSMRWIKAIGPFDYEQEHAVMTQYNIDVVISKNSGGQSTIAKLHVARDLGIPVLMFARPALPPADEILTSRESCLDYVCQHY